MMTKSRSKCPCGEGWGREGQEGEVIKGYKQTFRDDGYGHYLDYDNFTGVYLCQNLTNYTLQICTVYCMSIIPQ